MRTLIGPMIYPDGSPMANVTVTLRAQRVNWSADGLVANSIEQCFVTDATGQFAQPVAFGDYQVWFQLPDSSASEKLGKIVVEAGSAIELGELIELSRDASADWSISADWATRDWVNAQILLGGVPYDINVTALNPGAGAAGQLYKVSPDGLYLQPFTLQLNNYPLGNGISRGLLYEKADGTPGTLPVPRIVSADTLAAKGDTIYIDMNIAAGDIDITLPSAWITGDWPRSR
ncbi:MAG: hypothetical protein R3E64_03970 [Halioglobus sp.]